MYLKTKIIQAHFPNLCKSSDSVSGLWESPLGDGGGSERNSHPTKLKLPLIQLQDVGMLPMDETARRY